MSKDDDDHPITEMLSIIAKAGIGLLPGGGTISAGFEAIQLLNKQAAKQMKRRSEIKYSEFISSLFKGEIGPKISEFLTADDYYALLSGCMADMENEKAKYYGKLAVAIGRGAVTGSSRRYMILTLTQLSEAQLQMLRKSFIARHYEIRPAVGVGNLGGKEILELRNAVQELEYNDLHARSLYTERKLTKLVDDLVCSCFESYELTPDAIGHVAWYLGRLNIISDTDDVNLILALIDQCQISAIKTSQSTIFNLDQGFPINTISHQVLVMSREQGPDYLLNLVEYVKPSDLIIVICYGHEQLVRQYYPNSIIIDAIKISTVEVTELVIKKIKPFLKDQWYLRRPACAF